MSDIDGFLPEDEPSETNLVENEFSVVEGDDSEEQQRRLSPLAADLQSKFNQSKQWRRTEETRWIQAYQNYRGLYNEGAKFTKTEKSKAFIKITKTKVMAAFAQIVSAMEAGQRFPITVQASKAPVDIAKVVHKEKKPPTPPGMPPQEEGPKFTSLTPTRPEFKMGPLDDEEDAGDFKEGPAPDKDTITYFPAARAAHKMDYKVQAQLKETKANKHLRLAAFECALFGSGLIKGPFVENKEYPRWNEEGVYDPAVKKIPKISNTSIWRFYPCPDSKSTEDMPWCFEEHMLSKAKLRRLKRQSGFLKDAIDMAVEKGFNEETDYWTHILDDNENHYRSERYRVLEFWGTMDYDLIHEYLDKLNIELPERFEDFDDIPVTVWMCNDQIIKLAINEHLPLRIPYYLVPYEENPYSLFGIGVAENMEDQQMIMNGFWRLAVDNAVLSSNVMLEIDRTYMMSSVDNELYPGKVFEKKSGGQGTAIQAIKIPNITNECLMMFDKARQLADEATGLPSFSHGISSIMSTGRTASGMSMLMGAAAQNIQTVVLNFDDYVLEPLGQALFAFNMRFDYDPEIQGDLTIMPTGVRSLMRNEVRSQKLLQLLQMTANPLDAPYSNREEMLKELCKALDLDPDVCVFDHDQALKNMEKMGPIMAMYGNQNLQNSTPAMGGDPTGTGGGLIVPGNAPGPSEEGFSGNVPGNEGGPAPTPAPAPGN